MINVIRKVKGLFPVKKKVLEKVPELKQFKHKKGRKND